MEIYSGRNQSYARKVNNKLVISKLRNGDCSATILVNELNLSNSAMSSILKELETQGVIIPSFSASNLGKGRKQIYYTLNKNYGVFAIVCLSNNRCKIILSNLKEEILLMEEKEIDKYDVTVIYEIILAIKNILAKEEYRDLPLRNIYIAVPGKVNSVTGELQLSKQFDSNLFEENNKIVHLFQTHFDAPIIMQNDTNLAIIGEKRNGELTSNDALLAYVDNGIGAAMILNGEFYGGDSGYAGELGLMTTSFKGKENFLDEFVSLRSIKNYVKSLLNKNVKTNDVVELFKTNQEIKNYILETAHCLGRKLKDVIELLNISNIIIQGRVHLFGDEYLKCIQDEIAKSQNQCEVRFSNLNGDSIFIGAMSEAVDHLIDVITLKSIDQGRIGIW